MRKKSYDEASVIRSLSRKSDVFVDRSDNTINVTRNSTELGNGSWGKIDYLCKVHGYVLLFTDKKINKRSKPIQEEQVVSIKTTKRESKLNMANMAKNAMSRVANRYKK